MKYLIAAFCLSFGWQVHADTSATKCVATISIEQAQKQYQENYDRILAWREANLVHVQEAYKAKVALQKMVTETLIADYQADRKAKKEALPKGDHVEGDLNKIESDYEAAIQDLKAQQVASEQTSFADLVRQQAAIVAESQAAFEKAAAKYKQSVCYKE